MIPTDGHGLECRARVEELVDSDEPLEAIERAIDGMALPLDERDGLALWAWAWRQSASVPRPNLMERFRRSGVAS